MEKVKKEVGVKGEEEIKEEEKPRTKRFSFKLILVTLFLLGLIVAGFFAYGRFFPPEKNQRPKIKAHATGAKDKGSNSSPSIGSTFSLDPFIVNLTDDSGEKYLKVNLTLELGKGIVKEELDKRLPQIRDVILILLSSKSFADIKNVQGKLRLREEIISRLNNTLVTGEIKEVYFTEFVVQ